MTRRKSIGYTHYEITVVSTTTLYEGEGGCLLLFLKADYSPARHPAETKPLPHFSPIFLLTSSHPSKSLATSLSAVCFFSTFTSLSLHLSTLQLALSATPASSHTVTSFLLPVRSPCTPPPPPGMKCSCSMVFCLLLAKAIRRALGWPPIVPAPPPPWGSQPPCMPIPGMAAELRSWSWPGVGWEFILIMWWRSMDGVTQMFCCDWAFWWWLSRPMVGTIPLPAPLSAPPTIRPIANNWSSRRSGDTRSLSWDLEPQTCYALILNYADEMS